MTQTAGLVAKVRLPEVCRDVAETGAKFVAERACASNHHNRNNGGDEAIFKSRHASVVRLDTEPGLNDFHHNCFLHKLTHSTSRRGQRLWPYQG